MTWRFVEGASVLPVQLCADITEELQTLKFPKKRSRKKLTSEKYSVLWRYKERDTPRFGTLGPLLERFMSIVDPKYDYTHVAVTKNFVGSPHIDKADATFQYVSSFGDFTDGGELAVLAPMENEEDGKWGVVAVSTKCKVCRVDGRFPHFVLPFSGGDRFSLVFYSVDEDAATARMHYGVDCESFIERVKP